MRGTLTILRSWKCLYCANRQYEKKRYERPKDIPCRVSELELENSDLEICPHFEKYIPFRERQNCPNCSADRKNIKHHTKEGEWVCHVCGCVVDDKTWGQLGKGTRSGGYYD
jgi:hypothetical protein